MRISLAILCLYLTGTLSLFGQNTFGEITGTVTDPSGASVPGVNVTVTNPATNVTRTGTTNSSGNYNFPSLLPGNYDVKATMTGFQTAVRAGVELQVQQTARIDFRLDVGEMSQTVEVSGGAPLVNTENASVGTVIDNRSIVDLPLNGRDFLQLVALSPNVTSGFNVSGGAANGAATSRLGGQRANESIAVSGTRREFNNYTLDGLSDTEVNFNAYIFLPSIDALQEFKVQTGVYSAEFGRGIGQVTASTKSGTNEFHGVLFEFLRNDALDARQTAFTNVVPAKSPLRWNNYGFTISGPVVIPKLFNGRNRLFFMSNYEGFREHQQSQQVYSTPTQTLRNGDFSQLLPNTMILNTASGTSPATRMPFPNNVIPASQISPVSKALLAYYPLPNIPGAGLVNNYLNLQNNTVFKDQYSERLDFSESSSSTWFGRYSGDLDGGVTPALYLNGYSLNVNVAQAMLANTRILSPTLVNDARFGFDWFHNQNNYETTNDPRYNVDDQLGLQLGSGFGPLDYGIPQITINGFSTFGTPTEGPYDFRDVTLQWNDAVSWTHGKHSFKFGADIRRDRFNTRGNAQARGAFTFGNLATNYGFADFLLGYQGAVIKSVTENVAELRATSQAYYVTDTWKLRSNFTIDVGLRYEFTPPWSYRNDTESNWSIPYIAYTPADAASHPHPTLVRVGTGDVYANSIGVFNPAIQVVRDGRLGPNLVKSDYTNFAPRLGIAYSPTPDWSIRLGGGIFYAQDIGQAVYDVTRNFAGRITPAYNNITDNLTWSDPYLANGPNPCGVSAPHVCISTPGPLAMQYDRHTPYVEQWTLSVQRQLSKSMVFEADYLGSEGHHLQKFHYLNRPVPGTGAVAPRTPWPEIGTIQYVDGDGDSSYESLVGKVTKRLSGGLSLLSSFTFARGIDDAPEIRFEGSDNAEQNSACVNPCERGLSQFSQKLRFLLSGIYQLPVGRGQRFLNRGGVGDALLGGWQLTSIITLSSGFPEGVTTGIARSGATGSDRPNATGQSVALANPTATEWFNINAFSENAVGQFGNVGRNVVIGPGVKQWDFSLMKNFKFTEQRYLQFRFECFNCSNHPNLGDPGLSMGANQFTATGLAIPGTGTFGAINSLRGGLFNRQLQFSLKLYF